MLGSRRFGPSSAGSCGAPAAAVAAHARVATPCVRPAAQPFSCGHSGTHQHIRRCTHNSSSRSRLSSRSSRQPEVRSEVEPSAPKASGSNGTRVQGQQSQQQSQQQQQQQQQPQQQQSGSAALEAGTELKVQQLHSSMQQPSELVQQLTSDMQQLLGTVRAQQETLQQQATELQQLRATVSELQAALPSQQLPWMQQQQQSGWSTQIRPFDAQKVALVQDRRQQGQFDARFHSTSRSAVPSDMRVLPDRIILVRHAQSEGNVNQHTYTYLPDPQVPLTALGREQAHEAGRAIRSHMDALHGSSDYALYFYTSPYKRGLQTYEGIRAAFASSQVLGVQEDVQLREQDFGNFQDAEGKQREKAERLRFGRFFYRFPNGESGADVYDRITVFLDHLVRDINAGRFPPGTSLVLVTHGLALRIWLMRWFHWTVDSFMDVYNPPNAVPLILERTQHPTDDTTWVHTKAMYRLSADSMKVLRGVTPDMCATSPLPPGSSWNAGSFVADDPAATSESAAEQWAELGGGW